MCTFSRFLLRFLAAILNPTIHSMLHWVLVVGPSDCRAVSGNAPIPSGSAKFMRAVYCEIEGHQKSRVCKTRLLLFVYWSKPFRPGIVRMRLFYLGRKACRALRQHAAIDTVWATAIHIYKHEFLIQTRSHYLLVRGRHSDANWSARCCTFNGESAGEIWRGRKTSVIADNQIRRLRQDEIHFYDAGGTDFPFHSHFLNSQNGNVLGWFCLWSRCLDGYADEFGGTPITFHDVPRKRFGPKCELYSAETE